MTGDVVHSDFRAREWKFFSLNCNNETLQVWKTQIKNSLHC